MLERIVKRTLKTIGLFSFCCSAYATETKLIQEQTAQSAPDIEWQRNFGGKFDDWANAVQQTKDGGYIVAGQTISSEAGNRDVYLIKTDINGDIKENKGWEKTFGGAGDDYANSVQQTKDEGYIVAGATESFKFKFPDAYLIKTDSKGEKMWEKTFGGNFNDWARSVQQTKDDGYVVAGYTNSFKDGNGDIYLIRIDSSGNKVWENSFGNIGYDDAYSVQQTSDDGFLVAGATGIFGTKVWDVYLAKANSIGEKQWSKIFGGKGDDQAHSIEQTRDGGYIVAGDTDSFRAGGYDMYLIRIDYNGNKLWRGERMFGRSKDDHAYSVQQTSDGGFIIAGRTESFGSGDSDIYLVKTNSLGERLWEKIIGYKGDDWANAVQQTKDGGYIVAGGTKSLGSGDSDVYLIKLAPEKTSHPTSIFSNH